MNSSMRSGSRTARSASARPWQYSESETGTETDRASGSKRAVSAGNKRAPARPWQYSESESETESETGSSETSSSSGSSSYTTDTLQRSNTSQLRQIDSRKNREIIQNYKLVKAVPIATGRSLDTQYYRPMSSTEGRRTQKAYYRPASSDGAIRGMGKQYYRPMSSDGAIRGIYRSVSNGVAERSMKSHQYPAPVKKTSFDERPQRTPDRTQISQTTLWNLKNEEKIELKSSSVFETARSGNLKRMQRIVQEHPHVIKSKNGMGNTVLHIAAEEGHIDIVKWLATNKVKLDATTPRGYTAIHLAAMSGHVGCLRVLAAMGAIVNCKSSTDSKSPLHLAAMKGNLECVKWLIANGDTLYATDESGHTPRALAEQYGHKDVAEFLRTCEKEISDPKSFFTLMKSKTPTRKPNDQEKKTKRYISECKIGSLRENYGKSGDLFQPLEIRLPVSHSHRVDTVAITLPSGRTEYPSVKDRYDGTLAIGLQPTETGLHQMEVTYANKKKGGIIPFIIDAVHTSRTTAGGNGLHYSLINESGTIWIENKDSYTDTPLIVQVGRNSPPPSPPPKPRPPPPPKERKSRCELSLNIPVTTTTAKADLIFALDSSASVGEKNFEKQLDFVMKIIQKQKIGHDHVQCSLVTFSSAIRNMFYLNSYHDKDKLLNAIKSTEYEYGKTFTGEALRFIRKQTLSQAAGAREDCQKLVIVLTDGASTNKLVTLQEAEKLKACHNVTVIAIGVGKSANRDELKAIATNTKHVFRASSFNALSSITKHVKLDSHETWNIRMSCLDQDHGPPTATFDVKYTSPFNMRASVTRPSGEKERCIVNKIDDCRYRVKFLPVEVGIHKVDVREYDTPIPGSPFEFMIEPADRPPQKAIQPEPEVDSKPEQAPEPPLPGRPYEFKLFTRDKKAGDVRLTVEGPSKATFSFDNRKNGTCTVTYTVTEPGDYVMSVKCDNEHIEQSPFTLHVSEKCSYVFCDCKSHA